MLDRILCYISVCLLLLATGMTLAVEIPPEVDKQEVIRRGNMVQQMGTIQDTEQEAIAAALAPPEDDSHKWYISVVLKRGDANSELLRSAFTFDETLGVWANPNDQQKSWSHYQVRYLDDMTQKDWLHGVKAQIEKGFTETGAPCVIIQPPRDGTYGKNAVVVAMLFGFDGDTEELSNRMRDAISDYVAVLYQKNQIVIRADDYVDPEAKRQGSQQRTVNPPFPIQPSTQVSPFDIPPKRTLTLQEIQLAAPGADIEFLSQAMQMGYKNVAEVQQAFAMYQMQQHLQTDKSLEVKSETPNFLIQVLVALAGGNFLGLIALGWSLYRAMTKNHLIPEDQFKKIFDFLNQYKQV